MNEPTKFSLFQSKQIRRIWHNDEWWFSVVDIVAALTDSADPKDYWYRMKVREEKESEVQLSTICRQLKLEATDGKKYETDCANTEAAFRIIQSIPSPKAEPFKLWLARVGYERIQEITDPEQSLNRARANWQKHGRSEKWIQQRMMGQETRNKLTDYWSEHGIKKGDEFAILTNIIHEEWSGVTVKNHKQMKGLKTQNLRDHMTEAELIFTALAELSTRQIAKNTEATGMAENKEAGKKGGRVAKNARLELEQQTGQSVISKQNYMEGERELLDNSKE